MCLPHCFGLSRVFGHLAVGVRPVTDGVVVVWLVNLVGGRTAKHSVEELVAAIDLDLEILPGAYHVAGLCAPPVVYLAGGLLGLDEPAEVVTKLASPAGEGAAAAVARNRALAEEKEAAAAATARAARNLVAQGLTYRDTAVLLDISHQRVAQLVSD